MVPVCGICGGVVFLRFGSSICPLWGSGGWRCPMIKGLTLFCGEVVFLRFGFSGVLELLVFLGRLLCLLSFVVLWLEFSCNGGDSVAVVLCFFLVLALRFQYFGFLLRRAACKNQVRFSLRL